MELSVTEKELRALSLSFRSTASRYLKGDVMDAISNLRRMLTLLDNEPILAQIIERNVAGPFNMDQVVSQRGWRERYPIPTTDPEEIAFTHQLLKHIVAKSESPHDMFHYVHGYNGGGNTARDFEAFSQSLVLPFVNKVHGYLEGLMDDIRKPDEGRVTLNNYGSLGQVNVSQDSSTLNATNYQGAVTNIKEAGARFLKELHVADIPDETKGDLQEATELALEEAGSDKPKKSVLSMCAKTISGFVKNLPATLTAAKAGKELVDLLLEWTKSKMGL